MHAHGHCLVSPAVNMDNILARKIRVAIVEFRLHLHERFLGEKCARGHFRISDKFEGCFDSIKNF